MHGQIDPVIDSFSLTPSLTDNTIRQTNQNTDCVSVCVRECVGFSFLDMAHSGRPDVCVIALKQERLGLRFCNMHFLFCKRGEQPKTKQRDNKMQRLKGLCTAVNISNRWFSSGGWKAKLNIVNILAFCPMSEVFSLKIVIFHIS